MTAMATPAQPAPEARLRPVPWRGMAWVSWRQHRSALAGLVAVLGAAGLYLYITGMQIRHELPIMGEMFTMSQTKLTLTPIAALSDAASRGLEIEWEDVKAIDGF